MSEDTQVYRRVTDSPVEHESTDMSQSIGKISMALSKAQGDMKGVEKNKTNPFFKAKYADLSSLIGMARDALSKNEIAVIQTTGNTDKAVIIKTMLSHSSGEWLRGSLSVNLVKFDAQALGSAITYGRRYALAAMLNVAQEDDDGNSATAEKMPKVKISKQQKDDFAEQVRECLANNDESGLTQILDEWENEEKIVLWGLFNSQERSAIKKLQAGDQ